MAAFDPLRTFRGSGSLRNMLGPKPSRLCLAVLIAACGYQPSLPDNNSLGARIERHVQSAHPQLRLDRYARFYAHTPDATVRAIYVDARIVGQPGESVWTLENELPLVSDAGCGVVMIEYDAANDAVRSSRCDVGGLE